MRASLRSLRILLAEDNKVNQFLASRLLGKLGHTVVVAASGREALAALDKARAMMDAYEVTVAPEVSARRLSSPR